MTARLTPWEWLCAVAWSLALVSLGLLGLALIQLGYALPPRI